MCVCACVFTQKYHSVYPLIIILPYFNHFLLFVLVKINIYIYIKTAIMCRPFPMQVCLKIGCLKTQWIVIIFPRKLVFRVQGPCFCEGQYPIAVLRYAVFLTWTWSSSEEEYLVGGFNPLKNISQMGRIIPNIWKVIKFMFQTTNQIGEPNLWLSFKGKTWKHDEKIWETSRGWLGVLG